MPGDESRTFMREVHSSKTVLPTPHVSLPDRVVVSPDEEVIDGDVLELNAISIWAEDLLIAPHCDDNVRVDGPLSSVQSIDKCPLLLRRHLHDVPAHCVLKDMEEVSDAYEHAHLKSGFVVLTLILNPHWVLITIAK